MKKLFLSAIRYKRDRSFGNIMTKPNKLAVIIKAKSANKFQFINSNKFRN